MLVKWMVLFGNGFSGTDLSLDLMCLIRRCVARFGMPKGQLMALKMVCRLIRYARRTVDVPQRWSAENLMCLEGPSGI